MKKAVSILLTIGFILTLTACRKDTAGRAESSSALSCSPSSAVSSISKNAASESGSSEAPASSGTAEKTSAAASAAGSTTPEKKEITQAVSRIESRIGSQNPGQTPASSAGGEKEKAYSYELNAELTDWLCQGETIYAVCKNPNTLVRIDTAVHDVVRTVSLPGASSAIRIQGKNLYVSFSELKSIGIYRADTLKDAGRIKTNAQPYSFCMDGDDLYYAERISDGCRVLKKSVSTGSEVQILTSDRENPGPLYPILEINRDAGLFYIGESDISNGAVSYYRLSDMTLQSEFRWNGYGYGNPTKRMFLQGNEVYWGEFRLNARKATEVVGRYQGYQTNGMTYVNRKYVCTDDGIYDLESYRCIYNLNESGSFHRDTMVTDSGTFVIYINTFIGDVTDLVICIPMS